MNIAISILSIYAFILLGFMAKRMLKEELNEKGMVLLTIYFLQPILSFWGLSSRPIDFHLMQVPLLYIVVCLVCVMASGGIAYFFFNDAKDKSIVTISAIIGNTSNLGIPLGIALFGDESIIYTSLLTVANIFVVYSLGVFIYSRGNSSIKESLFNIVKLPVIWFAFLALAFNFLDIKVNSAILRSLEIGAYCSMGMQLLTFGMYIYNMKLKSINYKLLLHVSLLKFLITPLIAGFMLFILFPISPIASGLIFLQIIVPLAVTNINLAALYECKPLDVTVLVFFTSLLFIPFLIAVSYFLQHFNIVSFPS